VKAGQFSRGKEITKQWNCYETIALYVLLHRRLGKVRHVNPDVSYAKKIVYFRVFFISVSTSMSTKKESIYGKGASFNGAPQAFGGAVAPNCPHWIRHCVLANSSFKNVSVTLWFCLQRSCKSVCNPVIPPAPIPCKTSCFVCFYVLQSVCVYAMDFVSGQKQLKQNKESIN